MAQTAVFSIWRHVWHSSRLRRQPSFGDPRCADRIPKAADAVPRTGPKVAACLDVSRCDATCTSADRGTNTPRSLAPEGPVGTQLSATSEGLWKASILR